LEVSLYVHFNPVAVQGLGLGKRERKGEGRGWVTPPAEVLRARLEALREHRWSSYAAYAGYAQPAEWLAMQEVLRRVRGGREGYRQVAERRLGRGVKEPVWARLRWGCVLGSERFAQGMRERLKAGRETAGRRTLRERRTWEQIVRAVERVRGDAWAACARRRGDWARPMALYLARRTTGLPLRALGQAAGGMDYTAVAMAVKRFGARLAREPALRAALARAESQSAK